jgi:hypothetical protein
MPEVQPRRINVGGTITELSLAGPELAYLLVRLDRGRRLVSLDLAGRLRGQSDLAWPVRHSWGSPYRQMRVGGDGSAWVSEGDRITRIGPEGRVLASVEVAAEPGEQLGGFLLLPDGFAASFFRPPPEEDLDARIARLDQAGKAAWSTTLPAGPVAYPGVVEMSVESGWQPRPKKAWQPEDWQPGYREPLLLSGDRLLASYFELRSGIGCSYCLDVRDGRFLWATELRPQNVLAIAGPGEFFVGSQGYGAFDTYLYGADGNVRRHWPSHGDVVITGQGEVRVVEMENCLPSRMHFSVFLPDGTVRKGPHLGGYYTTYPVVNREGVVAFWRNGKLRTVDASLQKRMLWQDMGLAEKAVMTRMLLADDGTLVFGLEDELFLVPTNLGPMADSPWPCGGGNAQGNPVLQPGH